MEEEGGGLMVDLGVNPVNIDNARRQAVESGLDAEHCILEHAQNAQDYGTDVHVILNGDFVAPHHMRLNSVIIKDNGIGMHHDTVLERFRGSFQDSESHSSESQAGRNGVGVKTAFQFWKNILVDTTTKGYIPEHWICDPEHATLIATTYAQLSTLHPGDDDTELRKYDVTMKSATAVEPWEKVPHVQSGTTITLKNPRTDFKVDVKEITRRLSHNIEFLSKKDNRITLHYKNANNNMTEIIVRPFYERDKPSYIAHAKGNSNEDIYITLPGKPASLFPKSMDPELSKIDFDIKVTLDSKDMADGEPSNFNEFIVSICGANVYDAPRKGYGPSNAITQVLSLDKFENTTGFAYRIHGYVKSQDIHLKNALRFNKSAMALQDKYAKKFFDYVLSLLKELNKNYMEYLDQFNKSQEDDLLQEVELEFNRILQGTNQGKSKGDGHKTDPHENTHHEYECLDCGCTWKVPMLKIPSFCAEYNITGEEGCGSSEIQRRKIKAAGTAFKWVPTLDNFIPARYEKAENVVYLAQFHPDFITTQTGKNRLNYLKSTAIQQGLVALTIGQTDAPNFEVSYGQNLKKHFYNKHNQKHVNECLKIWKLNKINPNSI
jgi:Histidine kinase-, DNA gyrase B-, and HSP90-like ATPase